MTLCSWWGVLVHFLASWYLQFSSPSSVLQCDLQWQYWTLVTVVATAIDWCTDREVGDKGPLLIGLFVGRLAVDQFQGEGQVRVVSGHHHWLQLCACGQSVNGSVMPDAHGLLISQMISLSISHGYTVSQLINGWMNEWRLQSYNRGSRILRFWIGANNVEKARNDMPQCRTPSALALEKYTKTSTGNTTDINELFWVKFVLSLNGQISEFQIWDL